jgi:hypothetical protein
LGEFVMRMKWGIAVAALVMTAGLLAQHATAQTENNGSASTGTSTKCPAKQDGPRYSAAHPI